MELARHTNFEGGIIEDGDPNKDAIRGMLEVVNLDIINDVDGRTAVRVRPPLVSYTDNGYNSVYLPNPAGYTPKYMALWQSGLGSKVQTNRIVAYRIVEGDTYKWELYSNAPAQSEYNELGTSYPNGAVNSWTQLEAGLLADDLVFSTEGGRIRIFLGPDDKRVYPSPSNDYRIFMDLVPGNATRTYFTSRQITRATNQLSDTFTVAGTTVQALGSGGKIFKGWLYDYGHLYDPFKQPIADPESPRQVHVYVQSENLEPLTPVVGDWLIGIATEWDNDPAQIGPTYWKQIVADPQTVWGPIQVGVTPPNITLPTGITGIYSPRITGFPLYAKRINDPSTVDMEDALRIATLDISTLDAAYSSAPDDIFVDEEDLGSLEGAWGPDTQNREIIVTGSGKGQQTTQQAAADIKVKAAGAVMRKEVMYAWGTDDDPGGSKIRESALPTNRGHYDVFPKWKVSWVPECSWKILSLQEWDDRIVQIHAKDIFHLEPADPLRARDSYTHGAASLGVGVPQEFLGTIARGKRGVFFANYEGIWTFRDGRATNILENRRLRTWTALSEAVRATSIGGYNNETNEYWLAYQTTPADDSTWKIWVWDDRDVEIKSWRDYVATEFAPRMFFNDEDNSFCSLGIVSALTTQLVKLDTLDLDGGDFGNGTIDWVLGAHFTADRSGNTVIEDVDVTRYAAENVTLNLYINGLSSPSQTFTLPAGTSHIKTVRPMRCNEYRWKITGQFNTVHAVRTLIYEIVIFGRREKKRRA